MDANVVQDTSLLSYSCIWRDDNGSEVFHMQN